MFDARLVAQAQGISAFGGLLLPMLLVFGIIYVMLIMPQQKRQKQTTQMQAALKNGDKVITNGGVFGTIVGVSDDTVQLRVADQVKVTMLRSAIAGLQPEEKKES